MNARREKCAVFLVLVLGVLARLWWFAYDPSLWNDEASLANNVIKYDLAKIAVTPLDDLQAAPPGYLLAVKVCGMLGGYSERSLRLFSLLCGLAALALFADLAGQLLAGWGRVTAVALFSLSGPLIYHSGEAKQYETEVLAAAVLLWLAVRMREEMSRPQAVFAGLTAAVCVLFANSAVFVLAGAFGALMLNFVLERKTSSAVNAGFALALGALSFLAYYVFLLRHNPNVAELKTSWADHFAPLPLSLAGILWYVRTAFYALVNPLGVSLDLDFPFLPHSTAFKYLVSLSFPALILFGVGTVAFFRKDWRGAAIVLSGMFITLGASLFHQYPLNERLIAFFAPMAYLAMGKAAERAGGAPSGWRISTRLLLAWLAVYVGVNFAAKVALPRLFAGDEKYSQMREAIRFIAENKRPDDAVFITWNAQKFYDYYNCLESLNWPVIAGTDPRSDAHSEDDVAAHVTQQIQNSLQSHPRVWFLLQDNLSLVAYLDTKKIKHETLTPTGVVYENVLHRSVKSKIDEAYAGHAAAALLVSAGP